MMHPFRSYIHQYVILPEQDWQMIEKLIQRREIKKNDFLLREGQICRHLHFLERGLLRYFRLQDGQEKIKFFTFPPYLCTSQRSLNRQIPSRESIQAIEDSLLWDIPYSAIKPLRQLASWNQFILQLIREVQYFTEEIYVDMQGQLAENRYRRFLHESPEMVQRIPLQYLASFLGIAPQSLSRIRKKILLEQGA
ncbi:MAG: cyclic nucleotide-binding domain-containing protein [Bacteroidota bacterium]